MRLLVSSVNSLSSIGLGELSGLRSWEEKNKLLSVRLKDRVSSFTTLYI